MRLLKIAAKIAPQWTIWGFRWWCAIKVGWSEAREFARRAKAEIETTL